jgi:DNA-binding transcriptional MerR regulator
MTEQRDNPTCGETGSRRFSLDELAALSGLPPRTVRYYIQEGVVDRPEGIRRGAWYEHRHLEQLLAIRRWQASGLSLERIRELVRRHVEDDVPSAPRRPGDIEVWSHVALAEGLELLIEPGRAGLSPEQLRRLAVTCMQAADRIRSGKE